MVCVDAVTLTYLLLHHPKHSTDVRAAADRDDEWSAPPLWRSELRSALMQYVRSTDPGIPGSELDLGGAIERAHAAEALIAERTFSVEAEAVLRLSHASGLSPYDCEYVALARDLDIPLLTYDRPVLRSFPDVALLPGAFANRKH